ncbi:uncharacterized protein BDZ99DRAFT_519882 [Mytilinidion resinicola]|uniref:Zn(2)-C6 fungal-type domain-containing protein n=1 Tax=Mytilinidion resinicola TaxID=574789 RepID=A0A6A6YTJ5_9PEZI|nr:uncharacterized protein BDZ99DRAFT_519882 [Mytilinidion resinicola]KAF2811227.1 hypothetical protein BDZ99DRAFT_519882 [Mytilinidion resinicola]
MARVEADRSEKARSGFLATPTSIDPFGSLTRKRALRPTANSSPLAEETRKLQCGLCYMLGQECDGGFPCSQCADIGDAEKCRYGLCKRDKFANRTREYGCLKESCSAVHSELGYGWDQHIRNSAARKSASQEDVEEMEADEMSARKRKRVS